MSHKEKVINVFFDTEFTDISPLAEPKLISVGMVSMSGREFYAELSDTYQLNNCSQFVVANVLPLLEGGDKLMLEAVCARRLQAWIESLDDGEVVIRCDSPGYDWPLVADMFNFYECWPKNLRRKCGEIVFENPNFYHRYNCGQYEYWRAYAASQHHALVDARGLRFAWGYAVKRRM